MDSMINSITGTVERLPYKQEASGSSPLAPTTPSTTYEPSGFTEHLPDAQSGSASVTQKCPEGCALRDELFAIKIWLEYWVGTKCESRHSRDANGYINNTWGVVPIPDWDVKQKIQRIDEALADAICEEIGEGRIGVWES